MDCECFFPSLSFIISLFNEKKVSCHVMAHAEVEALCEINIADQNLKGVEYFVAKSC